MEERAVYRYMEPVTVSRVASSLTWKEGLEYQGTRVRESRKRYECYGEIDVKVA